MPEEELSLNPENREGAAVIYYGKTFKPYGPEWMRNSLLNYVPFDVIARVLVKNIPDSKLPADPSALPKEKLVDMLMLVYNKASPSSKQRMEKWGFSHRFRRKVQTEFPFLKRLESFYMYLRTNPIYKIPVSPDVATKVAAQLTLTGIDSLPEVKSVLKTVICKKQADWQVFDSLFNKWFTSTIEQYGGTTIAPSGTSLHFETNPSITLEEALAKLRTVVSPNRESSESIKENLGGEEQENEDDKEREETSSENDTSPESEPSSETEKDIRSQILSLLKSQGPIHINDLKIALREVL